MCGLKYFSTFYGTTAISRAFFFLGQLPLTKIFLKIMLPPITSKGLCLRFNLKFHFIRKFHHFSNKYSLLPDISNCLISQEVKIIRPLNLVRLQNITWEYFFFEKLFTKYRGETSPRLFFKKLNCSYLWISSLNFYIICHCVQIKV